MKIFKSSSAPGIEGAVARAVDYELTIADIARRSERRAWWVAATAVALSMVLAAGYVALLPLKERIPYLVMADAYTGTASVARLQEDFRHHRITVSEAINRSNVAHFITARESYDLELQQLRDWMTVYTMSSPEVASGYTTLHARNNPQAPYNLYPGKAIRVRLLSITLHGGDGRKSTPTGATVRFQRFLYDKASGVSRPLDSKIATLAFTYKSNLKMSEEQRIANPLGFQVTSYRVDNDYAASPPLETFTAEARPEVPGAGMAAPDVPAMPAATEEAGR
ncbi:virB8 family protein [Vulcaniibacterium gelatinicum]|uniref:virB8 family protein n=1 Tax=Vulcaniibacterium gelatinicum TaxID=2598725 RepID=UPI0011C96E3D|nr:type IV secretion system protein [Vulcaniibacterium gelatinicum]